MSSTSTLYSTTHPSGKEFLRQLILFIDSHGSELLSSYAAFKIQPRAMEYLALRLEDLRELQRVKTSNPIRFLAGAVADLTDFLRMEKVQQFCSLVRHLKLYSATQDVRDPTPVNFAPFLTVSTLEIRGCDLSSCMPAGVENLHTTVERIICQNSLESLWHLLNPTLEREAQWTKLTSLSCIYNDLVRIDGSLNIAKNLIVLDLSRNQILEAQNLSQLADLTALDVSFNSLGGLGEIPLLRGLQRLFLQSNGIRSLDGISSLQALEELDLRWNVISSWSDVVKLRDLPTLKELSLEGNPLSTAHNYRVHVLASLDRDLEGIMLDGHVASEVEIRKVRRVTVSEDGRLEEAPAEVVALAAAPSYFCDLVFPFCNPFRRRRIESLERYDSTPLLTANIQDVGERPKPIKRIVDIPRSSYISTVERSVDPTSSRATQHVGSRGRSQPNGSHDVFCAPETLTSV